MIVVKRKFKVPLGLGLQKVPLGLGLISLYHARCSLLILTILTEQHQQASPVCENDSKSLAKSPVQPSKMTRYAPLLANVTSCDCGRKTGRGKGD
jgi:hypothetical protein